MRAWWGRTAAATLVVAMLQTWAAAPFASARPMALPAGPIRQAIDPPRLYSISHDD